MTRHTLPTLAGVIVALGVAGPVSADSRALQRQQLPIPPVESAATR